MKYLIVLLLCCSPGLAMQKIDLSGTWVLDKDRSFSNGPGFEQTLAISQSGESVKLEAKQKTPRGETTINEDYLLDGKEAEFPPQNSPPNSKGKRKATRLSNGRGILIEDEVSAEGQVVRQVTRKMTLSPDGQNLTVDLFIDDPQRGQFELKRVYNKVK
ncbi:MAG TPA: hypothetical protein VJ302_19920 [Blastocatellia bacterium]|nr:hypothetical protein [Blastocatellia bacterium]